MLECTMVLRSLKEAGTTSIITRIWILQIQAQVGGLGGYLSKLQALRPLQILLDEPTLMRSILHAVLLSLCRSFLYFYSTPDCGVHLDYYQLTIP